MARTRCDGALSIVKRFATGVWPDEGAFVEPNPVVAATSFRSSQKEQARFLKSNENNAIKIWENPAIDPGKFSVDKCGKGFEVASERAIRKPRRGGALERASRKGRVQGASTQPTQTSKHTDRKVQVKTIDAARHKTSDYESEGDDSVHGLHGKGAGGVKSQERPFYYTDIEIDPQALIAMIKFYRKGKAITRRMVQILNRFEEKTSSKSYENVVESISHGAVDAHNRLGTLIDGVLENLSNEVVDLCGTSARVNGVLTTRTRAEVNEIEEYYQERVAWNETISTQNRRPRPALIANRRLTILQAIIADASDHSAKLEQDSVKMEERHRELLRAYSLYEKELYEVSRRHKQTLQGVQDLRAQRAEYEAELAKNIETQRVQYIENGRKVTSLQTMIESVFLRCQEPLSHIESRIRKRMMTNLDEMLRQARDSRIREHSGKQRLAMLKMDALRKQENQLTAKLEEKRGDLSRMVAVLSSSDAYLHLMESRCLRIQLDVKLQELQRPWQQLCSQNSGHREGAPRTRAQALAETFGGDLGPVSPLDETVPSGVLNVLRMELRRQEQWFSKRGQELNIDFHTLKVKAIPEPTTPPCLMENVVIKQRELELQENVAKTLSEALDARRKIEFNNVRKAVTKFHHLKQRKTECQDEPVPSEEDGTGAETQLDGKQPDAERTAAEMIEIQQPDAVCTAADTEPCGESDGGSGGDVDAHDMSNKIPRARIARCSSVTRENYDPAATDQMNLLPDDACNLAMRKVLLRESFEFLTECGGSPDGDAAVSCTALLQGLKELAQIRDSSAMLDVHWNEFQENLVANEVETPPTELNKFASQFSFVLADLRDALTVAHDCAQWFQGDAIAHTGIFADLLADNVYWLPELVSRAADRCGELRAVLQVMQPQRWHMDYPLVSQERLSNYARVLLKELERMQTLLDEDLVDKAETWQLRVQQALRRSSQLEVDIISALRWFGTSVKHGQDLMYPSMCALECVALLLSSRELESRGCWQKVVEPELNSLLCSGLKRLLREENPDSYHASIILVAALHKRWRDQFQAITAADRRVSQEIADAVQSPTGVRPASVDQSAPDDATHKIGEETPAAELESGKVKSPNLDVEDASVNVQQEPQSVSETVTEMAAQMTTSPTTKSSSEGDESVHSIRPASASQMAQEVQGLENLAEGSGDANVDNIAPANELFNQAGDAPLDDSPHAQAVAKSLPETPGVAIMSAEEFAVRDAPRSDEWNPVDETTTLSPVDLESCWAVENTDYSMQPTENTNARSTNQSDRKDAGRINAKSTKIRYQYLVQLPTGKTVSVELEMVDGLKLEDLLKISECVASRREKGPVNVERDMTRALGKALHRSQDERQHETTCRFEANYCENQCVKVPVRQGGDVEEDGPGLSETCATLPPQVGVVEKDGLGLPETCAMPTQPCGFRKEINHEFSIQFVDSGQETENIQDDTDRLDPACPHDVETVAPPETCSTLPPQSCRHSRNTNEYEFTRESEGKDDIGIAQSLPLETRSNPQDSKHEIEGDSKPGGDRENLPIAKTFSPGEVTEYEDMENGPAETRSSQELLLAAVSSTTFRMIVERNTENELSNEEADWIRTSALEIKEYCVATTGSVYTASIDGQPQFQEYVLRRRTGCNFRFEAVGELEAKSGHHVSGPRGYSLWKLAMAQWQRKQENQRPADTFEVGHSDVSDGNISGSAFSSESETEPAIATHKKQRGIHSTLDEQLSLLESTTFIETVEVASSRSGSPGTSRSPRILQRSWGECAEFSPSESGDHKIKKKKKIRPVSPCTAFDREGQAPPKARQNMYSSMSSNHKRLKEARKLAAEASKMRPQSQDEAFSSEQLMFKSSPRREKLVARKDLVRARPRIAIAKAIGGSNNCSLGLVCGVVGNVVKRAKTTPIQSSRANSKDMNLENQAGQLIHGSSDFTYLRGRWSHSDDSGTFDCLEQGMPMKTKSRVLPGLVSGIKKDARELKVDSPPLQKQIIGLPTLAGTVDSRPQSSNMGDGSPLPDGRPWSTIGGIHSHRMSFGGLCVGSNIKDGFIDEIDENYSEVPKYLVESVLGASNLTPEPLLAPQLLAVQAGIKATEVHDERNDFVVSESSLADLACESASKPEPIRLFFPMAYVKHSPHEMLSLLHEDCAKVRRNQPVQSSREPRRSEVLPIRRKEGRSQCDNDGAEADLEVARLSRLVSGNLQETMMEEAAASHGKPWLEELTRTAKKMRVRTCPSTDSFATEFSNQGKTVLPCNIGSAGSEISPHHFSEKTGSRGWFPPAGQQGTQPGHPFADVPLGEASIVIEDVSNMSSQGPPMRPGLLRLGTAGKVHGSPRRRLRDVEMFDPTLDVASTNSVLDSPKSGNASHTCSSRGGKLKA